MINLNSLSLSDILAPSIKNEEILAVAHALDPELQEITSSIIESIILPRIDELPEDVVDSLAWQFHVDFYEPLGLDINKKRSLVKSSLNWHRRKGTKSVLVEMIQILYTERFKIIEWFEYGGNPGYFKIILNEDVSLTENDAKNISLAVKELKNVRSWLEEILITQNYKSTVYVGSASGVYSKIFIPSTHDETREFNQQHIVFAKTSLYQNIDIKESEGVLNGRV